MVAEQSSIGLTLLASLSDFIFPLITSKEVTLTYLHGPITVFAGLLHSFNITQNPGTTLRTITIELVRQGIEKPKNTTAIPNKVVTNIATAAKAAA